MTLPTRLIGLTTLLLLGLTACKEEVKPAEEIRPVRYAVAGQQGGVQHPAFSGEIRARYESRLAFRVGGKVVEKRASSGDSVRKGQVLAVLDASDYQLDNNAKQAQLAAAQAQLQQQEADLKRYRELLGQQFISAAQVERQQTAVNAARASVQQAQAALSASRNQSAYTQLLADSDGVLSDMVAEPGMVVAAGQTVARIAGAGEREVLIQVPESAVASLRSATGFTVTLWTDARTLHGTLRELAADADPATRTYAARISLKDAPADLRLGMTAQVQAIMPATQDKTLRIPLSAVLDSEGKHYVWVIDAQSRKVGRKAVTPGQTDGQTIEVTGGLQGGETIVTAGVHLLRDGQRVTLLAQ